MLLAEVNSFVGKHLWMDFSVWSYRCGALEVSGSTDESYWSDLRITFRDVCWANIRFQGWHSDTSIPILHRVSGDEERTMNKKYWTEIGNHLFKLVAEDFVEPMWVSAKSIDIDITRLDLRRN